MNALFLSIITLCCLSSCAQDKQPLLGDTEYQKSQNAKFKDASESPLTARDIKTFTQLDFFKYDETYKVKAKMVRTPDSQYFEMPTSTDRKPLYRVYAILSFELKGKTHQLSIYEDKDLLTTKGFEDYLFLPFIDKTNGENTYGGGRYIKSRIPEGDFLIIDFNESFNPYCAYNYKYSCPIVPIENYLDLKIEAGVKSYVKD